MSEGTRSSVEIAHHLTEREEEWEQSVRRPILEIAEAILLAIVAVATAWSGYQSELWTGRQAELYGQANKLRVQSEGVATYANQERLYNALTVVEWLKAAAEGNNRLENLFERRLLPEFRPAFEAWKTTDPLRNPNAPPGPEMMPEYRNSKTEEASELTKKAANTFEEGSQARGYADEYVRATVTLATVLLLIAISQRFKVSRVRIGVLTVAIVLLCFPIVHISTLPRL